MPTKCSFFALKIYVLNYRTYVLKYRTYVLKFRTCILNFRTQIYKLTENNLYSIKAIARGYRGCRVVISKYYRRGSNYYERLYQYLPNGLGNFAHNYGQSCSQLWVNLPITVGKVHSCTFINLSNSGTNFHQETRATAMWEADY